MVLKFDMYSKVVVMYISTYIWTAPHHIPSIDDFVFIYMESVFI